LLIVLVANLAFLSFIAYSIFRDYQDEEAHAQSRAQVIAQAIQRNIDDVASKIHLVLNSTVDELEQELGGKGLDEPYMTTYLGRLQARVPQIEAIRIANEQGLVILGNGVEKSSGVNWLDRDYFVHHLTHANDAVRITKPRVGRTAKQYIVNFSMRYNYPDGRFAGVVSAPISVAYLQTLSSGFDVGPNGMVAIRDQDFDLITRVPMHADRAADQIGSKVLSDTTLAALNRAQTSIGYKATSAADGVIRIMHSQRLEKLPFIVTVGLASKDYLASWYSEVYRMLSVVLFFGLASLFIWRRALDMLNKAQQADMALRENLEELQLRDQALNQVSQGVLITGVDRLMTYVNDETVRITGYSREELLGQPCDMLQGPLSQSETVLQMRVALAARQPFQREILNYRKDRTTFWNELSINPVYDKAGVLTQFVGVMRDVTERKKVFRDLAKAKLTAEALNIAKSDFVASMGHELCAPMNSILGVAQLLQKPGLPEEDRIDYAGGVVSSVKNLLTLLEAILDLAKIRAGEFPLASEPLDPAELMCEIKNLFSENARNKNLALECVWRGATARYQGDSNRASQILSNLVSNAIRFTTRGSIWIEAREVDCVDQSAILEFSVTDTGTGIADEKLHLLFQPKSPMDGSSAPDLDISGFGLSIVRKLAELMGGEVGAESQVGRGSRFWVRIRVERLQ
jgi:PAS domain S-box-containing protein